MRARQSACLAAGLLALGLAAAACGGDPGVGVANLTSGRTTPGHHSSGSPAQASPLAFSQCMQKHGITDFPDPNAQGQIALQGGPGSDLDPNNPLFQAAQNACQSLQPRPSAQQQAQMEKNALQFSRCMRAHGVPDFPDPQFKDGGVQISISAGSGGLDPNSPQFQAAQSACGKDLHLPKGAGPGVTKTAPGSSSGGQISSGQVVGG
jgi:hypothetical protein